MQYAGHATPDDPRFREYQEGMSQFRAELPSRPPFRVYGLVAPSLSPAFLADFMRADTGWERLTLQFGVTGGPYVRVRSMKARVWEPDDGSTLGEILIDEVPWPAAMSQHGADWTIWLQVDDQVTVILNVHQLDPRTIALTEVDDLTPFAQSPECLLERVHRMRPS